MQNELIFHHYDPSPFSEKVRLVLGLKRLAWSSVIVPMVLPKPDLVPLTGGNRRTPVLQIGADVYCGTNLIGCQTTCSRFWRARRARTALKLRCWPGSVCCARKIRRC